MKNRNQKDQKKRKKSVLEQELFSIMQKSLKSALDMAFDDLLKDFK